VSSCARSIVNRSFSRGDADWPRVFLNGTIVDLDTLIPPKSGFTITGVAGINDSGQVAADAISTGGFEHAVLLTPQ
jgi:hypothetical protein